MQRRSPASSSYRAHIGLTVPPAWLSTEELHRQIAPRAPKREGAAMYGLIAQVEGQRDG